MFAPLILRQPDDDGFVLIEGRVLQVLARHRQLHHGAPESGGILLGFRRGHHLHITDATSPAAADRRSRTSFFRSSKHHQEIALSQWRKSDETIDYLGEWHTHPEYGPSPSATDIHGWTRICTTRGAPMLFMIAGTSDRSWIGLGRCAHLQQLHAAYSPT